MSANHPIAQRTTQRTTQQGGTIIGFILGLIVGLGAALGVAVYVAKVPVPFMAKGALRGAEQDAVEAEKNRQWNPNQALAGKVPTVLSKPDTAADDTTSKTAPEATLDPAPEVAPTPPTTPAKLPASKPEAKPPSKSEKSEKSETKEATTTPKDTGSASSNASNTSRPTADPLGDFAKAKTTSTTGADTFDYFVQAGAFRTQADADAQRAKLTMLGWEARVSEREQNGRPVFRVRVGPFAKRDDAEQLKGKLDDTGIDTTLVRVQR